MLGELAAQGSDLQQAASFFELSLRLEPDRAETLYRLSLTYGLLRDAERARATALRLARIAPQHPGLAGWLAALGLTP
jgi:tetratricopeptide (TPR) repeat protein